MQSSTREIIDKALYFHRQNKTAEAEQLYSQALKIDENHPTGLHLLGVIRHQQNRNLESKKLILRALAIKPDDLLMMSATYSSLQKFEAAENLFSKVLSRTPANPQVLTNRGTSCRSMEL